MSDKKWDRFKRKFGVNPSGDLITGRDNKIKAALLLVDAQNNRLTAAGITGGGLKRQRDDIERSRTTALAQGSPKAQYEALDPVKDDARKLAADAPGIVDQTLNTLTGDLTRLRQTIQARVDDAEGLRDPLCQAAVKTELDKVKAAVQQAEGKPNDFQRHAALDSIDLDPLKAVMDEVQPTQMALSNLATRVKWVADNIGRLPDGQSKTSFGDQIKGPADELAALARETDLGKLRSRAEKAGTDASKIVMPLRNEIGEYETMKQALAAVSIPIDAAKAIRCDVGKAAVKAELDKVVLAVDTATKLVGYKAQAAALEDIAKTGLKDLSWAVADARNIDAGVPKLLDAVDAILKKLPSSVMKRGFEVELATLSKRSKALETETVLKKVQDGYADLRREGDELMERVVKARGADGFKEALEGRFGISYDAKPGAKVNLAEAYEALGMVPEGHVGHDLLTKLFFTGKPDKGASYGKGSINMDDFVKDDRYAYEVDGKPVPANAFSVCMLHEIGHGVDEKYKVMAGVMETAGAGNWKREKKDDVTKALSDAALAKMGKVTDEIRALVSQSIGQALSNTDVQKPGDSKISRSQWKTLQTYTGIAKSITDKSEPWFNVKPGSVAVGDRVYGESQGTWFSYSLAERSKASVRNYQWRSPDEWFADLYGIAWMQKKPLVNGLPDDVATWMPS